MSLGDKRRARKNTRATLSGKLIPADSPQPPFWSEIVAKPPETPRPVRTGAFYTAMDQVPWPEELHEPLVAEPGATYYSRSGKPFEEGAKVEHTGSNRSERRARLRRSVGGRQLFGTYTRDLERSFGHAKADHHEAKRLMRERAAAARTAARYAAVAS